MKRFGEKCFSHEWWNHLFEKGCCTPANSAEDFQRAYECNQEFYMCQHEFMMNECRNRQGSQAKTGHSYESEKVQEQSFDGNLNKKCFSDESHQRMAEEKCHKTPVDSLLCENEVNRCKDGFQDSHRNSQGPQAKTGHSYESEKVREQSFDGNLNKKCSIHESCQRMTEDEFRAKTGHSYEIGKVREQFFDGTPGGFEEYIKTILIRVGEMNNEPWVSYYSDIFLFEEYYESFDFSIFEEYYESFDFSIFSEEQCCEANLDEEVDLFLLLFNSVEDWYFLEFIYEGMVIPTFLNNIQLNFGSLLIESGIGSILVSLLIKLAITPTHFWALDVYEGAPTASTFFFSSISKLSVFAFLVRLCMFNLNTLNAIWLNCTVILSVLSILVGAFGGLKQRKVKTLLSYSSTNHMGYLLLGFSSNITEGAKIILFYFVNYITSTICLWIILLLSSLEKKYHNKYSKELGEMAQLKNANKGLSFSSIFSIFSISGIPPMSGFLAKTSIFILSLSKPWFGGVTPIAYVLSAVSTFYYLRILKIIYFENFLAGRLYNFVDIQASAILSFLIVLPFIIFIQPNYFYLVCNKIVFF